MFETPAQPIGRAERRRVPLPTIRKQVLFFAAAQSLAYCAKIGNYHAHVWLPAPKYDMQSTAIQPMVVPVWRLVCRGMSLRIHGEGMSRDDFTAKESGCFVTKCAH